MLFDVRFTTTICILFIALGLVNFIMGLVRLRAQQKQGYTPVWYKQMGLLTGIEYILLGLVLLINMGITTGWFPLSASPIVIPLFVGVLLLAATVLGMMVFNGIQAARRRKLAVGATTATHASATASPARATTQTHNRRSRKQKAAAARRRQSGRS